MIFTFKKLKITFFCQMKMCHISKWMILKHIFQTLSCDLVTWLFLAMIKRKHLSFTEVVELGVLSTAGCVTSCFSFSFSVRGVCSVTPSLTSSGERLLDCYIAKIPAFAQAHSIANNNILLLI